MTLNDLKNDVARLGFESNIEDEDCFIASVNRALSLIYTDRPVSKTAKISLRGPKATLIKEFIEHQSGAVTVIPFCGKSLSFRSTGTGSCIISDSSGSSTVPLIKDGQLTKQFVYGDGTLTFTGDFYFTVTCLAVFDDVVSYNASDIPEYTPYKEICPEEYCDDFRAFKDLPRDKNGKTVDSIRLIDGRICAPFSFRGDIYLTYYRTPTPVSVDNLNARIDVSEECSPMLSLLTASFTWLDEDAAKAQYYMSLYRDLIANVKRYSTNQINNEYTDNGWA